MSLALCFWILMLLWLVLGIWNNAPFTSGLRGLASPLLLFLLVLLLGWQTFGAPLHS